jgi:hypothetical protein
MLVHQLIVVQDDPVVDAHDGAVTDRVVVGLDPGVTLRVITNVDQRLGCTGVEDDLLEQGARPERCLWIAALRCAAPVA